MSDASERGKFLFHDKNGDYQILYSYDAQHNSTTLAVPGTNLSGFEIAIGHVYPPDKLQLSYINEDPNKSAFEWVGTTAGKAISINYNSLGYTYRSFGLPDGYLIVMMSQRFDPRYFSYTKVNHEWEESWTFARQLEPYNNPSQEMPIEVFAKDGFVYIFSGNMNGLKIDSDGNTVWNKRFTFPFDRLNSVIINNKQNFVLLGTHYHYIDDWLSSYEPTDLITVEVDQNGNIVD